MFLAHDTIAEPVQVPHLLQIVSTMMHFQSLSSVRLRLPHPSEVIGLVMNRCQDRSWDSLGVQCILARTLAAFAAA